VVKTVRDLKCNVIYTDIERISCNSKIIIVSVETENCMKLETKLKLTCIRPNSKMEVEFALTQSAFIVADVL